MPDIIIVHLTDPHFGEDHRPAMLWRRTIWHQEGHDIQLARALTDFLPDIRDHLPNAIPEDTPVHYVVSGDLTCRGSEKNFATAYSFLLDKASWSPDAGPVGLGLPNSFSGVFAGDAPRSQKTATAISLLPGNHDHWQGGFALPGAARHVPMPRTPWGDARIEAGDLSLDLFGLDSFDETGPGRRITQSGRLGNLDALESDLQKFRHPRKNGYEAAAIVIHHSLEPNLKNLDNESTRRLLALTEKYRVSALLTGHTHDSLCTGFFRPNGAPFHVREFRAPTSCCGPAVVGMHGFLVHHLSIDAQGGCWRAYEFLFNAGGSFSGTEMDPDNPVRF